MIMPKRIAFLTLQNPEGFFIYDELTVPFFQERGVHVQMLPWNQTIIPWKNFDLVIIRSTWDYQQYFTSFLHALEQIEQQTLLANSLAVVKWNYAKTYLEELADAGFSTIPTVWLDQCPSQDDFRHFFLRWQTQNIVIKPLVSANADHTFVMTDNYDAIAELWKKFFEDRGVLVQPFVPSIATEGEVSLFFLGGKYSHAVRKVPKQGDFRVQEEHGGTIHAHIPTPQLHDIALHLHHFLQRKFGRLLYARYDFVNFQGLPHIMEVELIEPSLYFPYHELACSNFVEATITYFMQEVN